MKTWLDNLIDRWRKPEKRPIATATEYGLRNHSSSQAAGALTPERVLGILKRADDGDVTAQFELFEEMERRDAELDGLFQQRKAGVGACDFSLVPGDEENPRSVQAAEFCQSIIDRAQNFNDDVIFGLLDALPKGFSTLEVKWETSQSQWWPIGFAFVPQRWWTVDKADRNTLRLIDEADAWKGIEVNPMNFIQHVHRARTGTLTRCGISVACARPFVLRNFAITDWMVMMELWAQPTRIGKLQPGATNDDKAAMLTALREIGANAYGVIPDGAMIEILKTEAKGSSDIYREFMDLMYRWYQIAILGQTLTSGGESGGSYALGGIHQNVRYDLVDSDAKRLDRTLSQFWALVTRLNFGPDVAPPQHKTQLREPKDLQGLATVVSTLSGAGLKIPSAWAYEEFGIPAPEEDESVLERPASPAPALPLLNADPARGAGRPFARPRGSVPSAQRLARSSAYLR